MTTDTQTATFVAQRFDPRLDLRTDLGTLSIGPGGHLALVAARPGFEPYLKRVIEAVNATKQLNIKVPPPDGANAFSVCYLTVSRTASDLVTRLCQYIEQRHDLFLVEPSAAAAAAAVGDPAQLKAQVNERLRVAVPKVKAAMAGKVANAAGAEERVRKAFDAAKTGDLLGAKRLLDEVDRLLGG